MKRKKKQPGYSIMMASTILWTLLAIATMIPVNSATKPSLLGYMAYCSFTPISTLICVALAGLSCVIRAKLFKK